MFSPQKLHPISYLSKVFKAIKDNILQIGLASFLFFKDGIPKSFSWAMIGELLLPIALFVFALITIIIAVVDTIRTRYWIENDQLMVRTGLFSTKVKSLYISRIQTVETTQNIINQLFGGVILNVKTAGDGVTLDTIAVDDAQALKDYLETKKYDLNQDSNQSMEEDVAKSHGGRSVFNEVYQLKSKDILLMSITGGAMGTVLAILLGIYSQLSEVFNVDKYLDPIAKQVANDVVFLVLIGIVLVIFSYIIGIFITALKYYHYELSYDGERLKIKHGLLERKEQIVIVKQIQSISERKSFLRQLLGFTSFKATIQSEDVSSENTSNLLGRVEILPFVKRKEGLDVMKRLIPSYSYEEVTPVIPKRSYRRYVQWYVLLVVIVTSIVQYYWWNYTWIVGGIITLLIFLSGYIRYKYAGYRLERNQLTIRSIGIFGSHTHFIKEEQIIEVALLDHYFMNRANLMHLNVSNSAGMMKESVGLKMMDRKDAQTIYDWFKRKEIADNVAAGQES